jgi:hypothetical protein
MNAYASTFNAIGETLDRIAHRADRDRRLAREEEADAKDEVVIAGLRRKIAKLEAALDECREYFEDRADADQEPGDSYPRGNEEMKLLVTIDQATGRRS